MNFACVPEQGCITCGDEAVAMRVVSAAADQGLALCADGDDRTQTVETALIGEVAPGDALLVHAGTALQRLERRTAE